MFDCEIYPCPGNETWQRSRKLTNFRDTFVAAEEKAIVVSLKTGEDPVRKAARDVGYAFWPILNSWDGDSATMVELVNVLCHREDDWGNASEEGADVLAKQYGYLLKKAREAYHRWKDNKILPKEFRDMMVERSSIKEFYGAVSPRDMDVLERKAMEKSTKRGKEH